MKAFFRTSPPMVCPYKVTVFLVTAIFAAVVGLTAAGAATSPLQQGGGDIKASFLVVVISLPAHQFLSRISDAATGEHHRCRGRRPALVGSTPASRDPVLACRVLYLARAARGFAPGVLHGRLHVQAAVWECFGSVGIDSRGD